jgi:Zn-dependent protease
MTSLSFRLGRIPVRVHLWFLLAGLAFGFATQRSPLWAAAWASIFVATAFVHELAHAVAASRLGAPAEVELSPLRVGHAARTRALSWGKRLLVSFAGPAASLVIGAAALAVVARHAPAGPLPAAGLRLAAWINLGWGLANLLPILPLDAGHALVAVLDRITGGRGEPPVRWLSLAMAAGLGVVALQSRAPLAAIVAALIALQNAQRLRAQPNNDENIRRVHLEAASAALERGDAAVAVGHCRAILEGAEDVLMRRDAVRLLAYAYATSGRWGQLMDLIESGAPIDLADGDLEKYERAARELGRARDALRIASLRAQRGGA